MRANNLVFRRNVRRKHECTHGQLAEVKANSQYKICSEQSIGAMITILID